MNDTGLTLQLTAALAAAASLACAAVCLVLMRGARAEARNCAALAAGLDAELTEATRDLDILSRVTAEQTRRICALEGRALAAAEELRAAEEPHAPPTITERRHRVLQLARRGVECDEIATVLNMPEGEVELMVGLGRAY